MPTTNTTTTKFKVDISDLKKNIQEANRQIKLANAEFKSASAGMDDWGKSADGLSAKISQVKKTLEAQKTILSSYAKQLDEIENEYGKNSKEAENMRIKFLNQEAAVKKTEKALDDYERQLEELDHAQENADDSANKLGKSLDDMSVSSKGAGDGFTVMKGALADLVAQGIEMAISAIGDLASSVLEVGQNFESSMSNVGAISGATAEELEMLTETAREYGSTTQFSATEAADALGYMALAGWDAQESADSLGGVLALAASSGMDLASASDMVTDYLSAFGLEAKDSAYFADILAYAQGNANTTAEALGEAFRNSAANLNAAGQDVETVTALLSMMANQGLKGSQAGTALSAIMRDITKKMKDGAIAIGETNIEVMDAEGNYRDLTDILLDVEQATASLGDAEKASALSSTFTADSIKGLNLVLNAGADSAANFEEELRASSGSASDMAKTMNDNLQGDIKAMQSAFEDLELSIYESANAPLRELVQTLTASVIPAFSDLVNGVDGASDEVANSISEMFIQGLDMATDSLPGLADFALELVGQIATALIKASPEVVNTLSAVLSGLLGEWWNTLGDEVVPALMQAIPEIITNAGDLIADNLPTLIENVINLLLTIVEGIPEITEAVGEELPTMIEAITTALVSHAPELLLAAVELFMAIVKAIPQVNISLAKALGETYLTYVTSLAKPLLNLFGGLWENIKNGAIGAWEGVKSVFGGLVNYFKTIFTDAWTAVKNVFSTGGKVFDGIKEGIENAFKAVVNALIRGINKVVATPFNALNEALQKLASVEILGVKPFEGLFPNIAVPQIPELATGGILKKGQVGLLEGDGAEAVIPLDQNKKWIKAVANELKGNFGGNGGGVGSSVTNYNFTQNNTSPKALSRLELYRQTQNQLNFARGF